MDFKKLYRVRNVFACLLVLVMLSSMVLGAIPALAASIVYESEGNNDCATADTVTEGYDFYGTISSTTDSDWLKFVPTQSGFLNLYLANIPTGCDYTLYFADSVGAVIASSVKSSNTFEMIRARVEQGRIYFVKICSASGASASNYYLFRLKVYATKSAYAFTSGSMQGDFTSTENIASARLRNMEYNVVVQRDQPASVAYNTIPSSEIIIFHSHGDPGTLYLYSPSGTQTQLYGNNFSGMYDTDRAIASYAHGDLTGVTLAIFGGERTGLTHNTKGNLLYTAENKGIWCSVGWNQDIDPEATFAWFERFLINCKTGITLKAAMTATDTWMRTSEYSGESDALRDRTVAGYADAITIAVKPI